MFSAIDSDTLVNRTTSVNIGQQAGTVSTRPSVLAASGQVSITATSEGDIRDEIISNALGLRRPTRPMRALRVLVRGVTIANGAGAVGGLEIAAKSDTLLHLDQPRFRERGDRQDVGDPR